MKQFYYWLFFLALLPLHSISQRTGIKGTVTDATNGSPLVGVSIMINTLRDNDPALQPTEMENIP